LEFKVLRPIILISVMMWAQASCSNSKLKGGPVAPGDGMDHSSDFGENLAPGEENLPSEDMERVSPPANISGAYLTCIEARPATASLPEVQVNCALRDDVTNSKVDLAAYTNPRWTHKAPAKSTVTVTVQELTGDPTWHVAFTVKGPTFGDVQMQLASLSFRLEVDGNGGITQQESASVSFSFVQWQSLDGGRIPAEAVVGGTENEGARNLYVCRIYFGNEIIPGLLAAHFNDPDNKSICYAVSNGVAIISHSNDAQTVLYRSDVLVIRQGQFSDYFEWLPAANGQMHAHAYASGFDVTGQPLYSCRGLQADGNLAEQTPGALKQGSAGCVFNFNGSQTRTDYEVLSWKQTGNVSVQTTVRTSTTATVTSSGP
jgi:hypothetical protein